MKCLCDLKRKGEGKDREWFTEEKKELFFKEETRLKAQSERKL
jgi:hypothetical protein